MAESDEKAVVLSYHDSLLRKSDVSLLEGPHWLNDKLIGFSFEYFENDRFKERCHHVRFISPDVTQFIKLELHTKKLVFLAVNDSTDASQAGGSHWSLLVFSRKDGIISHYDSNHGYNEAAARSIAKKIYPYLRAYGEVEYQEALTPQQNNCYDCGIYVVSVTECLCMKYLESFKSPLDEFVTPGYVSKKRKDLIDLILRLAKGR
ncbi:sentrin-specific protease 8-like [Lineus longissimus]|uniref:sentrin-specific protease 8-like n=1 Tax=Lineus longissimus TaxID=88925 RepID=UPI002B4F27F5